MYGWNFIMWLDCHPLMDYQKTLPMCQFLFKSLALNHIAQPADQWIRPALGQSVFRARLWSAVFQCVSIALLDGSYVKWSEETYIIICIYYTTACQTKNKLNTANIHMASNKDSMLPLSLLDLPSYSHNEKNLCLKTSYWRYHQFTWIMSQFYFIPMPFVFLLP